MDLTHIPAIDQHAHNLVRPDALEAIPYAAAFTEGQEPALIEQHGSHTLCYRRSLRDMAALLNCEPTEAAVLAQRTGLGLQALTQRCIESANLKAIYLDDGFLPDTILPIAWHQQFVPVYRLLRLERLAE